MSDPYRSTIARALVDTYGMRRDDAVELIYVNRSDVAAWERMGARAASVAFRLAKRISGGRYVPNPTSLGHAAAVSAAVACVGLGVVLIVKAVQKMNAPTPDPVPFNNEPVSIYA